MLTDNDNPYVYDDNRLLNSFLHFFFFLRVCALELSC